MYHVRVLDGLWGNAGPSISEKDTSEKEEPYHAVVKGRFLISAPLWMAPADGPKKLSQKIKKMKSEFDRSILIYGNRVRSITLIRAASLSEDLIVRFLRSFRRLFLE